MGTGHKISTSWGGGTLRKNRMRELRAEAGQRPAGALAPSDLPAIWHVFGDGSLAPRLLLLAKMIERVTSRKLQEGFGISVAQWRVLAFVCMSGPATASFIGEAAEVDPAEVSRAVKALVDAGLVMREFKPGSRKVKVISPTAEGGELCAKIRRRRQAYFSRITRRLRAPERAALGHALAGIAHEVVAERAEHRAADRVIGREV